jgi:predicted nucleic acid-binding protein
MPSAHYVVDASVILKWVVNEPDAERAVSLFEHSLHAPDVWRLECASALSRLYRRKLLARDDAQKLMADLDKSDIADYGCHELLRSALGFSIELQQHVYDCLYLTLALQEDIPLVTADKKFYTAVTKHSRLRKYIKLL